jgi:hypothetical protein
MLTAHTDFATPDSFNQALLSGVVTPEVLDDIAKLIKAMDSIEVHDGSEECETVASTRGTVELSQKIISFKTLGWSGWRPKIITKTVELVVKVAESEAGKWAAFLACVAGSAALTSLAYAYIAAFPAIAPITATVIVSAIIVGCAFCLSQNMITPDALKSIDLGFRVR